MIRGRRTAEAAAGVAVGGTLVGAGVLVGVTVLGGVTVLVGVTVLGGPVGPV